MHDTRETATELLANVEWQMQNFLPAKGETGKQCEKRRLIEAIADVLQPMENMRAALAPFADCVRQIAPDERDEEWAKFRLLVVHFRNAALAFGDDHIRDTEQSRVMNRLRAIVYERADAYSEKIKGEYRYAPDGKASVTLTHAEWREMARVLRTLPETNIEYQSRLRYAAQFLLDRIENLEWTGEEAVYRDWAGHVEPAIARLASAIDYEPIKTPEPDTTPVTPVTPPPSTTALGVPIGLKDRHGKPVHIGDTLQFDEREWGGPCVFVVELKRGEIHICGAPSDISEYCEIIKGWNE